MNNTEDNRRPEEIEHDIERTRAQLSSNIDAIQSKLTPGEMMEQALSFARGSLPADFGSNLNQAVRQNPIPVALIGLGVAWLMASGKERPGYMNAGRHSSFNAGIAHRPGSGFAGEHGLGFGGQGDGIDDHGVGGHITGDHSSGMSRAAGKAGSMSHDLKERASSTSQHLKEKLSATGQSIREKASELGSRVSESGSHLGDRSRDMAHDARMRASELGQRSQQQYYRAKDNFSHMLEEQPMVLGAIGLAVGALLGAMMPATRREDELMGHTRDDLLAHGQQLAKEQAGNLKTSAQHVVETAKEEAMRLAREQAGNLKTSAQHVAETAKEEAQRMSNGLHDGSSYHKDEGDGASRNPQSLH